MATERPKVVVVGGGIGGLFAANALIAHGLAVSVYEQAPELGEVGAGVFLTPNSVRHLQRVGLGPAVEKWGARVGPGSHYFRHDGAPIAPVQVTDSSGWNATFGMHRADLVDFLAQCPARRRRAHRPPCHRLRAVRHRGARILRQWRDRRGRRGDRRRWYPLRTAAVRLPAVAPRFPRHGRLSRRGRPSAHPGLAERAMADVARHRQALPHLPAARRQADQLRRFRARGPGDEGIMVGPRRSRRAAPRIRRLGPAHRRAIAAGAKDLPLGAL